MSELALPEDIQNNLVAFSPEDINSVAQATEYLPRVQVMGFQSELVTAGKTVAGQIILTWTKDRFKDLGKEVDFLCVTMRPKAMRMGADTVLNYFNRTDPEFEKVKAESALKDSGCMYGVEFLIYIPTVNEIATLFCGSKTLRREVSSILDLMVKGVKEGTNIPIYGPAMITAKQNLIKSNGAKKYTWYGMKFFQCSTPPSATPDKDKLIEEIKKFNNPPKTPVVEKVDAAAATSRET